MALYRYFKASSSRSQPEFGKEVEAEVKKEQEKEKKRGQYTRLSQEEKATIARYACENGIPQALTKFKSKQVKESSLRDWKKAYLKELKDNLKNTKDDEAVAVSALPAMKRGRPPLLGVKMDKSMQDIIVRMRERGTAIGTSVVVGIGRGLILKNKTPYFGQGEVELTREWARSVLRRMGYCKRRASSTTKVSPKNFAGIKNQFLIDIKSVVEIEDIPKDLILNWDQTAMKIVPSSSWTMEKRGCKRVKISATDDKRQITAVFACSLQGAFLPVQLIYQGTTKRCLPTVTFPKGWHITCTANHWSTEVSMIDYVKEIIVPYVTEKRKQLKLSSDYSALVIFDVFKGQCTEAVYKLLDENNILHVMVPANCTDQLQPLDLSVNKPAKDFMRSKFQEWYGKIICQQLEDKVEETVDLHLSVMKPLSAKWIVELFDYLSSRPNIVINGFKAAGIIDILDS